MNPYVIDFPRIRRCAALAASLVLLWPLPGAAAGILHLSRSELRLEPGAAPGELYAENRGDGPLYLDVEQKLLLNPGFSPEVLVPIGQTEQPGLLVTPNRLVLSPGQKYRMTLNVLNTPDRTQIWRLTFRPRERLILTYGESASAATPLAISLGYGVVINQVGRTAEP